MGKVKLTSIDDFTFSEWYQFPMGKVKKLKSIESMKKKLVSIPYGKGKIVRRGSEPQNNDRRGRSRGVHGVNGADSTSGSYFEKSGERRGVIAPTSL